MADDEIRLDPPGASREELRPDAASPGHHEDTGTAPHKVTEATAPPRLPQGQVPAGTQPHRGFDRRQHARHEPLTATLDEAGALAVDVDIDSDAGPFGLVLTAGEVTAVKLKET